MDDVEVRFSESETAQVLWALYEAIELADQLNALASRALFEQAYRLVRDRYDERR